jgi:hypothetical protein
MPKHLADLHLEVVRVQLSEGELRFAST